MRYKPKNLPWTLGSDNRISDCVGRTVADCRYISSQGNEIVYAVNADHEQTVSRLIALLGEWRNPAIVNAKLTRHNDLCKRTDSELKGGQ